PRVADEVLEDALEPAPQLGLAGAPELGDVAPRGQERLLDDVRGAHLRRQVGVELATGQLHQVVAQGIDDDAERRGPPLSGPAALPVRRVRPRMMTPSNRHIPLPAGPDPIPARVRAS